MKGGWLGLKYHDGKNDGGCVKVVADKRLSPIQEYYPPVVNMLYQKKKGCVCVCVWRCPEEYVVCVYGVRTKERGRTGRDVRVYPLCLCYDYDGDDSVCDRVSG